MAIGLTFVIFAIVLSNGCGPSDASVPLAPISGKVTYRGKPLPHGQVVMIRGSGQMIAGEIQADGTYRIEAPVGENMVQIFCAVDSSPMEGKGIKDPKSLVPRRYTSYATSGLTVNVLDGENTKDWQLTD